MTRRGQGIIVFGVLSLGFSGIAQAAQLETATAASGETSASTTYQARVVVGEAVAGPAQGATRQGALGFLAATARRRETTPPTGTLLINQGAAYANSPTVALTLSATDDSGTVAQMQFSNDNVTSSIPEAYATTKSWILSHGDGLKTVYAKFADAAGNWSAPARVSVTLDTVAPTVTIEEPPDGALVGSR